MPSTHHGATPTGLVCFLFAVRDLLAAYIVLMHLVLYMCELLHTLVTI